MKKSTFISLITCCFIFLTSCELDLFKDDPKITLSNVEDITANSVVLVASLTTKDIPLVVVFHYFDNDIWEWVKADICPANHTTIVKKTIYNLTPGKSYQYRATAFREEFSGELKQYVTVAVTNGTKEFTTLVSSILTVKEMKSDFSTINVKLAFTPQEANTKVQLDYTVNGNIVTKISPAYSSATDVNFKLENLEKDTYYHIKIKTLDKYKLLIDTTFNTCAVSDFDGNAYRIVTIGNQTWLQENFRGTHFANGDPIPLVTRQMDWEKMTTPAYCWYNNDPQKGEVYGGLYNWYAASDPRGLIIGYITPELTALYDMADSLGGVAVAGEKLKEAGFLHWLKPNYHIVEPNYVAANSTGFCGLPGGYRDAGFTGLGIVGYFWSNTIFNDKPELVSFVILYNFYYLMEIYGGNYASRGLSVRLMKKNEGFTR